MKKTFSPHSQHTLSVIALLTIVLSACGPSAPVTDPNALMTLAFATVNSSFTQTALAAPTNTPLPVETPRPTQPPQPTAFVPSVILTVTVASATGGNCRFGPDLVYVGRFILPFNKTLEATARDASAQWILVREPGGTKACWMNVTALTFQGDVATLAVAGTDLPISAKYLPPANIVAARSGDQVQISWADVTIEARDTSLESRFLLELWTCTAGQLTFSNVATSVLSAVVTDGSGCAEPSHGEIRTATKDGYSTPAPIPWP